VILIGLDGGTFDLIDPWVRAGALPAIGSLLTGARGELASTHPPLTPVAWPSLMTGCDPGQHGSWGFLKLDSDYRPQFLNGGSVPLPTVFELLSTVGLRVGTLNLPWTWPPREVNGWWLSGLDAPAFDPRIGHPPGLFEEIQRRFDGYFDKTVPPSADDYALDRLEDKIAKTGAIARYLARAHQVDLMAVAFVSTDHVQHWFWQSRSVTARDGRRVDDILLHTYRLIDREIARMVEECVSPETTVMLVSDHGAGPTAGGMDIAGWLSQQGWLRTREPGALGRLRRSVFRIGGRLLPGAIRERLRGRLAGRRRAMLARLLREGIDWERTRAFCWSDYGNLSLNLQDRF
jgi:predicted AlkP superfamily phosphohydrolase/phosphomutase